MQSIENKILKHISYKLVLGLESQMPEETLDTIELWYGNFVIIDNIESGRINSIQSLIHIHNNCTIKIIDDALRITQGEKTIYILYKADQFNLKIEDWRYIPEFGTQMKSERITIEPEDLKSTTVPYIISPEIYFKDALNYFTTHYSDFNLNNQHL